MASSFFALIFAENFLDLVFATYLALLGKRVGVIANKERLQGSADSLLLDPFRSRSICDWLGMPLKSEKDPYIPDFQIISPKRRLELFWDRPRREFALSRDLGEGWKNFEVLIEKLVELGNSYQEQLKQSKIFSFSLRAEIFSRLFSTLKPVFKDGSLGELISSSGINPEERKLLMAPLRLMSPYFSESSPLISAALAWKFLMSPGEGAAGEEDSWQAIFEILKANGALIEEQPYVMEIKGRRLAQLRLHSGREIDAEYFFAEPNRMFYLFEFEKRESRIAKALVGKFPRTTIFNHLFRMDTDLWPEPMSERVLWVPGRTEEPEEFLLFARPVTPKTLQVSLSYGLRKGEAKPLEKAEIMDSLKGLFPWLTDKKLKSQVEPFAYHQHLRFHPSQLSAPEIKTSFSNLFLTPSELVPLLGFQGMFRLAETMAEIDKQK